MPGEVASGLGGESFTRNKPGRKTGDTKYICAPPPCLTVDSVNSLNRRNLKSYS